MISMKLAGVACLATLAAMPTVGSAQVGADLWYGSRAYHGGLSVESAPEARMRPLDVSEIGATLRVLNRGRLSVGASTSLFVGAYGMTGPMATLAYPGEFVGYAIALPVRAAVIGSTGGTSLGLVITPAVEFSTVASDGHSTRAAIAVGPELRVPVAGRLGITFSWEAAVTSGSVLGDEHLPAAVENRKVWWSSLRFGVSLR